MMASNTVMCFVTQADDRVFHVDVDHKSEGQECFDKICKLLGLMDEADYFGLQYHGPKNELLWLNLRNRLTKQLVKEPYNLYFRVKFYVAPHLLLLEETRHQFYLNVARQLKLGVWDTDISSDLMGQMIALMAQAEFGNFNLSTTPCKYACFWPDEREEMTSEVIRIAAEHQRTLADLPKSQVEYDLFRLASLNMPLYGAFFYEARDCFEKPVLIGVSPEGVFLCSKDRKIEDKYPFARITKMSVSERVAYFTFANDDASTRDIGYRLISRRAANALYRCVTETHAFYCCETIRDDVVEQTAKDIKGIFASFFISDHNHAGAKEYMFDIRRTSRDVYDNARRSLYKSSSRVAPFTPVDANRAPPSDASSQPRSRNHSISSEEEVIELRTKIERMKDAHLCRVCMVKPINRVFFPCGHSVCCQKCADHLDLCPWCRTTINIRHPLYLAWPGDLFSDDPAGDDHTLPAVLDSADLPDASCPMAADPPTTPTRSSPPTIAGHASTAPTTKCHIPEPYATAPELLSTETLTDLRFD